MLVLIIGLIVFLGVHLLPTAPGLRGELRDRLGANGYRAAFSLASILGFVLIVYGWRLSPTVVLWSPPVAFHYLTLALMLPAMILVVAAYVPENSIKAGLGHPMILGVKTWAFAHLLSNGDLASLLLFGSFLAWAIYDFRSARRREPAPGGGGFEASMPNLVTAAAGFLLFGVLFALHPVLIGRPVL